MRELVWHPRPLQCFYQLQKVPGVFVHIIILMFSLALSEPQFGPITSGQNDGGGNGIVADFISLGSKIAVKGDCRHEIKRHLLLGRRALTDLDSILKSRNIILPTKVCLVKAMVFPVVMYGCESWIIKKAECQRIDAFELWC